MAERVYRKKANVTMGVTPPAEGVTLPAAVTGASRTSPPTVDVMPSAVGQTTKRVYRKKATTPTLSGAVGQTAQRTYTVRPEVKAQKLQTWFDDAMATVKATQDYVTQNEGKYAPDFGNNYVSKIGELLTAAESVRGYVDLYKSDAKTHGELTAALTDIQGYLQDFNTYAASVRDSHGKYADEQAYRDAVAEAEQYEEDLKVDTWAMKNDIQLMKGIIDIIDKYRYWENHDPDTYYDPNGHGEAVVAGNQRHYAQMLSYYGYSPEDKEALEEKLAAAKATYDRAITAQVKAAVAAAKDDPEYSDCVARGAAMDKPIFGTYDKIAAAMTQEQKEMYNYLQGKFGYDAGSEYGTDYADAYFEMVRGGIQQDEASAFHKKYLEDQWYEGVWSVVQGLDRTFTGLQNAFGKTDTDDRTFDPQMVGALVREDLGAWYNFAEGKWETKILGREPKILGSSIGQIGYDLATTTAAMVPAIGAAALSNLVVPGAGAVVMPAVMGLSSGGSAYKEALDRGYNQYDAQNYGMLVGASEAGLGYALNGVGIVGNSLSGNAIKKATRGIKNAALRFVVQLGGEMLSEATEEGLQEILTPFFENIALDADNTWEDIDWEMAGYSALMGALSAGLLQGGGAAVSVSANAVRQNAAYRKLGRQFLDGENGLNIDKAIAIGLSNAKGTDAYNAAEKIQKKVNERGKVSAYSVGRMVAESRTEQARRAKAIEAEVLETGAAVGYDAAAVDTVARAAVALNQRVRFAAEGELTDANNAAEYHRDSDTVLLNPVLTDVNMLIGEIMAHEAAHTAEGTKQLAALAKIAQRMEGKDGWESLKAEVKSEYAKVGKQLSDPEVQKEAVARWIGENLFKNKAFAQAVVDGDANVGNAFFYLIDRVRRAMGAKNASAGNLAMLERLFMQALNNRTIGPKEGNVQYSLGYNNAIDQLAAGKLDRAQNTHLKLLDHTPQLYIEKAGAKDLKIIARWDTAYLAMYKDGDIPGNYHGLGPDVMKAIPKALQDPLYIIKQKNGRIVAITEITVKGKRPVIVSIELDTFQSTTQDGSNEAQNYNLIVTFTDAKVNYLQNTIFSGNIVHKKNNEDPAHFILRLKSLKKALSNDDLAAPSGTNVAQNATDVNTHSMQEGAGVFAEDGGNSAQGALLPPEYRPGARAEGVDPNADVEGDNPSVTADAVPPPFTQGRHAADADTSPYTGEARAVEDARPYGEDSSNGAESRVEPVQVDEAAVLESAVRSGLQGKKVVDVDTSAIKHTKHAKRYLDTLERELGTPELVRRMWNATQIERPTGTVEIDGQQVDANAYVDAYEDALPNDAEALEQHLHRLEAENGAVKEQMYLDGTLEDYHFGTLKIDLQLFAAKRKMEFLQLAAGEDGKKMRQFYEKRLLGNDENHCQELINLLAGRPETYNPIANQKTLAKAKENLDDEKYKSKLRKRLYAYNKHDMFNSEEVAAASLMINDAINRMELEEAADLVIGLSRKGTEAGRAVQAFSMMGRLTPEGVLKTAARYYAKAVDQIVGDGADADLNKLAKEILVAIEEAEEGGLSSDEIANRIRNGEVTLSDDGDTSSTASGPPSPRGEGYGTADEPLTTEQISKMQNLTPGKRVSFYDLTDEQVQAFAPLENRLYRELKNKSPFIRRRFGEWRVRDKTPVQIATKAGQKRGAQKNTDTGWNIQVSGKVFGENRGHFGSSSIAARPYLAYINDITRNAVLLDTSTLYEGKSPNSLCMHTLYALADIGDGPQLLKLYVEEMYDPNQKGVNRRAYELLNIESQPIGAKGSQQNAVSPVTLPTDTPTIADLIAIVKSKDASYKPKAPEDVLVDDLAATEGAYLTRDAMADLIKRAVNECADIKGHVKRYVLKEIRKDDGALAQRIYEVYQKGDLNRAKMKRAMEEALGLPTLTAEDVQYIVEQTAKIQKLEDKPVEQADAIDDLYDYLGAKLPVSFGEKMAAWRKFAMLFNIRTHARNFFANLASVGVRNVDSAIATGLELMAVKLNWMKPEERAAAFGWRCTAHGQQILETIKERVPEAVLEMTGRGAKYEETTNPLMRHRKMYKSEWLNDLNDWNSEWLEREDIFFFKMAYTNALGQVMTARKATEVTDEMHAIAMKRALEATFRNKTVLSRVLSVPKRGLTSDDMRIRHMAQVYDVVLPFVNTPAAIMEQTAMHSPIGLAVGFADLFGKVWGKSDKASADIINDFAKGIHGSALFYLGFMAVQWGILRIGYRSGEKDKAADEMEGRMENAIIIGDTAISIDWLQPLAAPLIMGGAVAEALADQDDDTLDSLFGVGLSAANSLLSLSMLQSFYDAVGSYGGDAATSLSTIAENAISQSVPTLLGQVARMLDPVQRKVQDGTLTGSLLNPILAKIPFATRLLDPELDVWGNEVYRTGAADGAGIGFNIAQQLAVPWNTKRGTAQDDPISAELLRLYHSLEGNPDVENPGAALPTNVTRKEAKAEGEDWTKLNQLLGGVNRLAVEAFLNNEKAYDVYVETGKLTDRGNPQKKKVTKYYRDMTDEERVNVLSGIYEDSKAEVLGKTDHIPEEHLNDSERYIRDLLRRVREGERGSATTAETVEEPTSAPAQEQVSTSYYEDLLRRMRNGN